jgi:hypothetical protein
VRLNETPCSQVMEPILPSPHIHIPYSLYSTHTTLHTTKTTTTKHCSCVVCSTVLLLCTLLFQSHLELPPLLASNKKARRHHEKSETNTLSRLYVILQPIYPGFLLQEISGFDIHRHRHRHTPTTTTIISYCYC